MGDEDSAWRGACADRPASSAPAQPHASWDLDVGDSASWLRALEICASCPALELCRAHRRQVFPDRYPVGVIWAGVPYSDVGQPMDLRGLRRFAATRRGSTRPAASPAARPDQKRIS